ncbi:hypothetical protein [Pseudoalteromonas holothuriae]|uniref:hypothetical protein n=1 Tax=Pseudoalteromonas holothuriae TaxID=2963714 RepID=UPI0021C13555|nr:hypothetical protein [Pseudoalteromonas sp. CIP111951]
MFKPISTLLVALAIMTALTGQVFAVATMACEMSASSHQKMMTMDHSLMPNMADCCDTQCTCPASACLSLIFLNYEHLNKLEHQLTEPRLTSLSQTPQSIITSLYRPPIFA